MLTEQLTLFRRGAILLAVLATCGGAAPSDGPGPGKPVYYAIKLNDKLVGYAVVQTATEMVNGQEIKAVTSEASLKVAMLGKERILRFDSVTRVRPDKPTPVSCRLTFDNNGAKQYVECEFAAGSVRTWAYEDGAARGEATETKLPDGTMILGSNNFAHWQWLLRSVDAKGSGGQVKVPVFLPQAKRVEELVFAKQDDRETAVAGVSRRCTAWRLEGAGLVLLVDSKNHEFVRMEIPAQQTTVELADEAIVKIAQKSRAEEALARLFTQSNVIFDDFLRVDSLKAEIDVAVTDEQATSDVAALTTPMQSFSGSRDGARVQGEVTIRSQRFGGDDALAFPAKVDDPQLAPFLEPSQYIESREAAIAAKASELAQGANSRWEVVLRVGRWVYGNIRYRIADTPSAKRALTTGQGDCGPHSTLTIALLRAVGIPARLVGGLLYAPTFGGTFGQHGWVEVHMGSHGWIPIDPTTGEWEQLSATHIRLFEGLGGVVPKSVKVIAYQPPNRAAAAAKPAEAKPLPWKLGKEYRYRFLQDGQLIGTESFTITSTQWNGAAAYAMKSRIELAASAAIKIQSSTTLVAAPNGSPRSFLRDLEVPGQKVKIECAFEEGTVKTKISGTTNLDRDIRLPTGVFCFDNNLMGSWALICPQLTLTPNKAVPVRVFHPSSLQIMSLEFTAKEPQTISAGGVDVECFECAVAPIQNTFWISRDGKLIKAQQGKLVIELTPAD